MNPDATTNPDDEPPDDWIDHLVTVTTVAILLFIVLAMIKKILL